MTYRSIVVHLDDSPRCEARVALAGALALAQGSHLMGLAATGLVNLVPALQSHMVDGVDLVATARSQMKQRATAQVSRFIEQIAPLGLVSHDGRVHDDDTLSALLQHARASDLVVLSQNDPKHFTPLISWDFPQQVFLHAGRPVLVVPYAGSFTHVGERVVVGWNDSREAARALADALPVLRRAGQVNVLSFQHPTQGVPATQAQLDDVGHWLHRHGVSARVERVITELDAGNALLSSASDHNADLLVAGGYGHSRVTEVLVGGVTRSILSHMSVPVLFSH